MTLETMLTEARQILGQVTAGQSNFTDAQLTTWANEFYRRACVMLESVPIKERDYTTSVTITLNSNMLTVDKAKFLAQPAAEWRELQIIDLTDLYNLDPDWENAATNIPTHLVRTGAFAARLYPGPNSANNSQASGLRTHGMEFPTSLSASSDTPDLPANIHDQFPYWMAYKGFLRVGDNERATQMLITVREAMKAQRQMSTRFSRGRGWKWHDTSYADPEGLFA